LLITVVVGKVIPIAENDLDVPVVQVNALAVPLSRNRNIAFCPSVGVPASALMVSAPACAVAAHSSKLSLFQAKGDVMLAEELTLGVIVLLVSV
jgi:hypothetical protein